MKLFSAGASPFGRKVKLALHVLSLEAEVEIIPTDTSQPDTENRKQNTEREFFKDRILNHGQINNTETEFWWIKFIRPKIH